MFSDSAFSVEHKRRALGIRATLLPCNFAVVIRAGVNVNIANIPMPSAEERAEMDAIDRKLDAIAAKLKA